MSRARTRTFLLAIALLAVGGVTTWAVVQALDEEPESTTSGASPGPEQPGGRTPDEGTSEPPEVIDTVERGVEREGAEASSMTTSMQPPPSLGPNPPTTRMTMAARPSEAHGLELEP